MLTLMSLLVAATVATAQTESAPPAATPARPAAPAKMEAPVKAKKVKKAKKAAKPKADMTTPAATPAAAMPAAPTVTTPAATTTAMPAANTTTTAKTEVAAPVKKWGGSISIYAARNVKPNAEELLSGNDANDADAVTEVSTITTLSGSYKIDDKNKVSVNQRFFRDSTSNSTADSTTKIATGNMRLGYTRSTDATIMGSDKIALPFQMSLPTVLEARRDYAKIADLRFIPDISWTLNPTVSVGYSGFLAAYFNGDASLSPDDSSRYNGDKVMKNLKIYTINSGYVNETMNDSVSFFQSVGVSHGAKNHKVLFSATQYSYSLELSLGATVTPQAIKGLSITADVTQTAPLQEGSSDVLGKPIPYTSGIQLMNGAQSSYELTAAMSF